MSVWSVVALVLALGWSRAAYRGMWQRWRAEAAEIRLNRAATRVYRLEAELARHSSEDELWDRARSHDPSAQDELAERMRTQIASDLRDGPGWLA